MNFLEMLTGNEYPKFESAVYADGGKVVVTVSRTLSPTNVDLDSPGYVENKFKKLVPILTSIGVTKNDETGEQTVNVTVEVNGRFNSVANLKHLAQIAGAISKVAEDKLSEPEVIKNIGLDCKQYIHADGSEEAQADA